jgi:CheY-like chemotaxis protein/HAMP domain-containing protein
MKLLKNLSIRNKLVLLLVLPLAGLLYFQQKSIVTELKHRENNQLHAKKLNSVRHLSMVIHELQQESMLTRNLAVSRHEVYKNELTRQQAETDEAVEAFERLNRHDRATGKGRDLLTNLPKVRNTSGEFPSAVHEINRTLMSEIAQLAQSIDNGQVKGQLLAYVNLLNGGEDLVQIQNLVTDSLEKSDARAFSNFFELVGRYELNIDGFKKMAPSDMLVLFESNFEHSDGVAQMKVRFDSVSAIFEPRAITQTILDSRPYVNASMQALKKVEHAVFERIQAGMAHEADVIASRLINKIALTILVFLIILSVAGIVIKAVVNSVTDIKHATDRITKGDIEFALNIDSDDEMGQLAASFNNMVTVFQDYIHAANAIGRGDYETDLKLKSDKDFLGRALMNMRDNLNNLSKEKETRAWLLRGNNELNDKLREEKDVRNLSQDVITQVATYLKVQVGAIYLMENGQLNRVGSYALDFKTAPESFALGQSLVGQAALEKRTIIFNDVPADYIKISSALGSAVPTNIIVFPFLYIGKVKGVIELGSTRKFTSLDVELLQVVGNSIAISFNSSQSRSKLKELLEETQRQAEALESQQEELRQFNDELLEKINAIEKSEAVLKVQQEELQQSNAELEEAASILENEKQLLEKSKAIIEAKAQNLESVSKYKSEFLANMSHELRTPLNSILILTQLLIENKNGTLNEKELKYAQVIYNSGNELLTLINDILDLSKVESGKMELSLEEVTIGEIFTDMSMMFTQVAKAKSIDFKINASTIKDTIILTDKQRLEQILRNLLSNAFKFTSSKGAVTLLIHRPAAAGLHLKKLSDVTDIVAFSVSDTGIGIPKDKQELIFEAFRQVDSTDKRKYGGTGLGLSICRELCELLGGEIQLISEEGKGSTFTLYLPMNYKAGNDLTFNIIAPGEREEKKPEEIFKEQEELVDDDRGNLTDADKRVLILEDDKEFAQVILGFVRDRNYKGIIAHQGNVGLSHARQYKPNAILLDMKLPVMDGEEVIRQLKSDPNLRHIPVQIISGYSRRKEAMRLGAFDFIKKPVTKEDLQKVFERLEEFTQRKYKRLLVVSKNSQDNNAMCELIGNGDVECFSALSGEEAFVKLTTGTFDCLVLDIELSDMTGITFLEKIKSNDQLNKVPIIVYAAQDLTKEQHKKLNALANTVVVKTASSFERLLDETTLFLHRVEADLSSEKQSMIRKLHRADEVLRDKTVLIVDDDIRNIYSLTSLLEEEGMQCLTAENGREALELLNKNNKVHIILMDVMMPEMDGYEATLNIRKLPKYARVPIIALTAKAMKGDREKCLAVGMSDYITKPLDIGQLLSLMRVWLYDK